VALLTYLRAAIFLVYPLLPLVAGAYGLRLSRFTAALGLSAALATLLAVLNEEHLLTANLLLSLLLVGPVLLILFAEPVVTGASSASDKHVATFFRSLLTIQVVNNLIGIAQFIAWRYDDAFVGVYGRHGQSVHGLGVINAILFIYLYARWRHARTAFNLAAALFFGLSAVMAFFGLALVTLVGALAVFHWRWLLHPVRMVGLLLVVGVIVGMLYATSKKTLDYNVRNVTILYEAVADSDVDVVPRKLRLFLNYSAVYRRDPIRLLFGTGPGTFNSRASFLLNGDYSEGNIFERALGVSTSNVARRYAHPLWSTYLVSKPFQDGTLNQPFSSLIALLSEYGLVFTLLVAYGLRRRVTRVLRHLERIAAKGSFEARVQRDWLKMATIFVVGMLIGDNQLEFTEVLVFVIGFKLIEVAAARRVADME